MGRVGKWKKQKQDLWLPWVAGEGAGVAIPKAIYFKNSVGRRGQLQVNSKFRPSIRPLQHHAVFSLPFALFNKYSKITFKKLSIKSWQSLNMYMQPQAQWSEHTFNQLHTVNRWMSPERQPSGLSSLISPGHPITRSIKHPKLTGYLCTYSPNKCKVLLNSTEHLHRGRRTKILKSKSLLRNFS